MAWLSMRARSAAMLLAVSALLAGCEGGSGQSGGAFVFLSVVSIGPGTTSTGTITSSINETGSTLACATLQNDLKNPTITSSSALDNVVIQSYTVTLTPVSGGGLPGPFTFGTAVFVPATTSVTSGMNTVTNPGRATFPITVVPAGAKLDPRVRPPNPLPITATAQVKFRGRDGRGQSVEAEGAATVVFVTTDEPDPPSCQGAPPTTPTP